MNTETNDVNDETNHDIDENLEETIETGDESSDIEADALAKAEAKANEHWNLYLMSKAETDNVRKRSEKEVSNARLFALEKFVNELLPIKDSLEMGIKAAGDTEEAIKLKEGSELTLKMFENVFNKFGVAEINNVGDKLNPELHEAVTMIPQPDAESNTVIEVIQKGYTLNKRLVRPAMVVVAK